MSRNRMLQQQRHASAGVFVCRFPSGEMARVLAEIKRDPSLLPAAAAAPTRPMRPTAPSGKPVMAQRTSGNGSTAAAIPAKAAASQLLSRSSAAAPAAAPAPRSAAAGYSTPAASVPAVSSPAPGPDSGFGGFMMPSAKPAAGSTTPNAAAGPAPPGSAGYHYPQSNPIYQVSVCCMPSSARFDQAGCPHLAHHAGIMLASCWHHMQL